MLSSLERLRVRRVAASIVAAFLLGVGVSAVFWAVPVLAVLVAFVVGALCGVVSAVWAIAESRRMGPSL